MEKTHQLNLTTVQYEMLMKMVVAGNFTLIGPYAPDSEEYDNELFEFFEVLVEDAHKKGIECDVDEITYETMDCIEDGFLASFAHDLATRDSIAKGYKEEEILENEKALEYHVERHNHYNELFFLFGTEIIGLKSE